MEYHEVINGRRSTRGFIDKPVSVEVLKEVIELAVRAPSSMNTQPWHFHIVTGEVLDNIRRENTKRNVDGVPPSREIKSPLGYQGKHRERQVEIAIQEEVATKVAAKERERESDQRREAKDMKTGAEIGKEKETGSKKRKSSKRH